MSNPGAPRYDAILFDLDGTLIDPYQGIAGSILHALDRLGMPHPPGRLDWCIGPPLSESMATLLGTDDPALIEQGIMHYRERFTEVGIVEQTLYPCAAELLHRLHNASRSKLYLATSKPRVFAERIIAAHGIATYFRGCYGAELDGTRGQKRELIAHLLESEGLDPERTVMIGDRKHDVLGARGNGVATVGVTWGYGGRRELEEAGADHICDDLDALAAHLLGTSAHAPAAHPGPDVA